MFKICEKRAFRRDENGNIAVMTAFALTALLMGTAAAIDFSGSSNEYDALQDAVDAAVLAAAKTPNIEEDEIKAMIVEAVNENFTPSKQVDIDNLDLDIFVDDDDIDVTAKFAYSTSMMSMFGRDSIDLLVDTGAPRNQIPSLNLALVVDTTESMRGPNMDDLQAAVNDLLDTFEDNDADIRISLVPYGQYVNVGLDAIDEPWVDASQDRTQEPPTTIEVKKAIEGSCEPTGELVPVYETVDTKRIMVGMEPEQKCKFDTVNVYVPAWEAEYEWNGCMGSRDPGLIYEPGASGANPIPAAMNLVRIRNVGDAWEEVPTYIPGSYVPGVSDPEDKPFDTQTFCGQQITTLTDDIDTIRGRINSLDTSGETYLPSGLIWGWRTLDPQTPYTQAAMSAPNTQNVMIFLTDGGNSSLKVADYHVSAGDDEDKAREGLTVAANTCEAAKRGGVDIFTVAYNFNGDLLRDETIDMLRDCATEAQNAFQPDNRQELIDSFSEITAKLATVRIRY